MSKQKPTYNRIALRAFITTFLLIIAIGIPSLFVVKEKKVQTATVSSPPAQYGGGWEEIPEAAVVSSITVAEETGDDTDVTFEIPDEDADYTHVIDTADPDAITIGFAGDILFDDNYAAGNAFKVHGNSAEGVIGESLLSRMRGVDLMVANNEFPYSNAGTPTEGKTFTFRARPETAQILNTMGVDLVGLANNHAYDYGQQALLDSFDALDAAGITYMGAGHNLEEASHPVYYITNSGIKVALICATQIERLENPDTKGATETSPGVFRCWDDTLLLSRIKEAREKNAFVVVFVHWGTESTTELDQVQLLQARDMSDAGANLIIGAHPHVLQRIDFEGNTPVFYSLGNYIFNSKTLDSCMVEATIHKDGTLNVQFIPAIQSDCTVKEAFGADAERILQDMRNMSPGVNLDAQGYVSK